MARYPRYEKFEERVASFTSSFHIKGITANDFASAGFYSIGVKDYTRCFYCGVGLRGWDDTDDPWKQHAKFSSSCKYLLEKKGENFVKLQQSFSEREDYEKTSVDSKSETIVLTDKEIALHVQSRMDERKTRLVIEYKNKLGFDEESLRKAIEIQFKQNSADFESTEEMIKSACSIFKKDNAIT